MKLLVQVSPNPGMEILPLNPQDLRMLEALGLRADGDTITLVRLDGEIIEDALEQKSYQTFKVVTQAPKAKPKAPAKVIPEPDAERIETTMFPPEVSEK